MEKDILKRFRFFLLFSGVFNVIFAFLLILPVVYEKYLLFFNYLNSVLMLGGKLFTVPDNPLHALFINTAGIDLVLIGIIIILVSKKPLQNRGIIAFNAIGRILFAFVIIYYIISADLIRIILVFGIIDITISIAFLYFLFRLRNFRETQHPEV